MRLISWIHPRGSEAVSIMVKCATEEMKNLG
jgi:hypothetical protein